MSAQLSRRSLLLRAGGAAAAVGVAGALTTPVPHTRVAAFDQPLRTSAGTPRDAGKLDWGADAQRQTGWLLVPDPDEWGAGEAAPVYPVVVMIHGGSWSDASDPGYMADLGWDLARSGLAVWAPTYRGISGPGGWPTTFQDVSDAIDFAAELGGPGGFTPDLERVHLLGHSAGGHLAAWALGRDLLPETMPGAGCRVIARSATAMAGIYDLARVERAPGGELVRDLLSGATPEGSPQRYAAASPIDQLPLERPVSVLHGSNDEVVPVWTIESYVQRHDETRNAGAVEVLQEADHDSWVDVHGVPWARARMALMEQVGA